MSQESENIDRFPLDDVLLLLLPPPPTVAVAVLFEDTGTVAVAVAVPPCNLRTSKFRLMTPIGLRALKLTIEPGTVDEDSIGDDEVLNEVKASPCFLLRFLSASNTGSSGRSGPPVPSSKKFGAEVWYVLVF